ncbi:MAG: hypothetical protein M3324_03770 [Actinomycetota bacterium]|nr:hypothetical protein [Actinomycetota bacterium]
MIVSYPFFFTDWIKSSKEQDSKRKRLEQIIQHLIYAVQADRISRQLDHAQKVIFRWWGIFAIAGIALFAWAANPPTADTARLDSELSQLSKRIDDQQRDIDSLSSQIDTLNQKVEDQQRDVSSLSSRVDTLTQETDSLTRAVTSLQRSEAIRRALQNR